MEFGLFSVEDVYVIKGKGVVAAGIVADGTFCVGDSVLITQKDGGGMKSVVRGIEIFGHFEYAAKGDCVGILLADISEKDIRAGDVIKR